MPNAWAVSVIFTAKFSSVPLKPSARTTAASLAERVISAKIASLTVIDSPVLKPNLLIG